MKNALKRGLGKFILFCFRIYYVIIHRIRVEGRENVPKEGALIFCANHRSFLDPPFINITLKRISTEEQNKQIEKNILEGLQDNANNDFSSLHSYFTFLYLISCINYISLFCHNTTSYTI